MKSFEGIRFSEEITDMFALLIKNHEPTTKVFFYIYKNHQERTPTTIQDIVDHVTVVRRVAKRKGGKIIGYQMEKAQIDRKTTERIVDRLYYMSLIKVENKLPFKEIYLNVRGDQVLKRLASYL